MKLIALLIATAAAAPAIVVQNTQYDPTNPNIPNGGKWINDSPQRDAPGRSTATVQNGISCKGEENGYLTKITHGRCSLEIRATSQDISDSNSHNEIYELDPNADGYFEISYEDWTSKDVSERDCDNDIKVKVDWTNVQLTNNQINVQVDMKKTLASASHQLMAGYEYRQLHDGKVIASGWNHVYHNVKDGDTTHTETFQWHAADHPCQGCGLTCEISPTSGLVEVHHHTLDPSHDTSLDQHRCFVNGNDACQCMCMESVIPTGCVDHLCSQCKTGYAHATSEDFYDGGSLSCHPVLDDVCDCSCHNVGRVAAWAQYVQDTRNNPVNDCWLDGYGYDKSCCPVLTKAEKDAKAKALKDSADKCDCSCHNVGRNAAWAQYVPDERNFPVNDCWLDGYGYDKACCTV